MELLSALVAGACVLAVATAAPSGHFDPNTMKQIANVTNLNENTNAGEMYSKFSPRMDFNQWKPLTGRGDPLRNDPTYDYEPPVLERVHYWADEPRPERDHRPERKSEVLMLGISSLKHNLMPRMPSRRPHKPTSINYEDFNYKLSEHFPMTILVPPPPPPPAHKQTIFNFNIESTLSTPVSTRDTLATERPKHEEYTGEPSHLNSLYALQEANLIYQSSTTHNNWFLDVNGTKPRPDIIHSDYVGWGPTTTVGDNISVNDTFNDIVKDNYEITKHPYLFYKPILSEAPPPPPITASPLLLSTFVPTVLPPLDTTTQSIWMSTEPETTPAYSTTDPESDTSYNIGEIPTSTETPFSSSNKDSPPKVNNDIFGMFESMISMPIRDGSEKPDENVYQHASENIKPYKKPQQEDALKLESMQTLQPPPRQEQKTESTSMHQIQPNNNNNNANNGFGGNRFTLDPYLNMRFATSPPTVASLLVEAYENQATTTETTINPTSLIIQGHSKVKTYSSKPNKNTVDTESSANEIPKPNETNDVKHLHPLKSKTIQKNKISDKVRKNNARNLKSLITDGIGSIEIQEADVGIKYDVSDGSDVPIEVYRKGIVESDENVYSSKSNRISRNKRQVDLEDLLPFDEDQIEEYVYNFFNGKKNETGITGLIASAVTSDLAEAVQDDIDDDDER